MKNIALLRINVERSLLSSLQKDFCPTPDRDGISITRLLGFSDNSKWPLCFEWQSGCRSGIIPESLVHRLNNSVDTVVSVAEKCWQCVRFTSSDSKCKDERHPPNKDGRIDNRYRVRGELNNQTSQHSEVSKMTSRIKNLYIV